MGSGVNLLTEENDLGSHLVTELSIKVGEGLIHKEYLAVTNRCDITVAGLEIVY